ncbi:MAG: HU family DNA-binding protein [Pseudomonadota bacterium]|nr:HU family DNA-binding protein [Pseudomonadota bacterium]MDP1904182.1 HU family DNA-binding protein [Pseudomonadota bacterium]
MNKSQLIEQLAARCGTTNTEAGRMLGAFTEIVSSTLANGDSVILAGFGIFEARERAARNGRNPHSGEQILIPAKRLPKFRPGSKLLEAVAE